MVPCNEYNNVVSSEKVDRKTTVPRLFFPTHPPWVQLRICCATEVCLCCALSSLCAVLVRFPVTWVVCSVMALVFVLPCGCLLVVVCCALGHVFLVLLSCTPLVVVFLQGRFLFHVPLIFLLFFLALSVCLSVTSVVFCQVMSALFLVK